MGQPAGRIVHHPRASVLYVFLTLILACITTVLWWQLSRARELNAQLHAEVLKLRGRVRALRP